MNSRTISFPTVYYVLLFFSFENRRNMILHQGSDKLCAHHCRKDQQQGGLEVISVPLILGHKETMPCS